MQVVGQPCRQNRIVPIAYIDSIQNRGLYFCNPHFLSLLILGDISKNYH